MYGRRRAKTCLCAPDEVETCHMVANKQVDTTVIMRDRM